MEVGTIKDLLRWFSVPLLWLSGRANRKRLFGARVEIVAMVMSARPTPRLLMARSVYNNCWMPPQEGVNIKESFFEALARGLSEECNIKILEHNGTLRSDFYLRDIRYVGTLRLPPGRWGERSVAGDVSEGLLSHVRMTKKAYWAAYIIIGETHTIRARPNCREINELKWMTFDEASTVIQENRDEKAVLLMGCLRTGMQHVVGDSLTSKWIPPGNL